MGQIKKIFLLSLLLASLSSASSDINKKIQLDFSGFVRYDAAYDTRQTVNAREGIFMLYPEKPVWDKDNYDINAVPNFNMFTISSFLKLNLTGPDVLLAKSNAYFETDFWGSESNKYIDLNHFRVRHAYFRLNWGRTELLFGQYWNPMSVPGFFPRVISSNSGVPFHPISRNPQIKLVQNIGPAKLIVCAFTQRDFTSTGPDGASSKYSRNSGIPNLHLQLQMGGDSSFLSGGAGIDYKKIVPELYMNTPDGIIKTGKKNSLSSLSFVGFTNIETRYLSVRMQGLYARNSNDILMLGGYGVKGVTNAKKGEKEFSNLNTLSAWGDIQTTGRKIKCGIFCGYSKNMGSGERIEGPIYARGSDINSIYRISPRIIYEIQPVKISLEGEYTTATYGTENGNLKGGVTDTNSVFNFRTLLSVKYCF